MLKHAGRDGRLIPGQAVHPALAIHLPPRRLDWPAYVGGIMAFPEVEESQGLLLHLEELACAFPDVRVADLSWKDCSDYDALIVLAAQFAADTDIATGDMMTSAEDGATHLTMFYGEGAEEAAKAFRQANEEINRLFRQVQTSDHLEPPGVIYPTVRGHNGPYLHAYTLLHTCRVLMQTLAEELSEAAGGPIEITGMPELCHGPAAAGDNRIVESPGSIWLRGQRLVGSQVVTRSRPEGTLISHANVRRVWQWEDEQYRRQFREIKAERRTARWFDHAHPEDRGWRLQRAVADIIEAEYPDAPAEHAEHSRKILGLAVLLVCAETLPVLGEFGQWDWESKPDWTWNATPVDGLDDYWRRLSIPPSDDGPHKVPLDMMHARIAGREEVLFGRLPGEPRVVRDRFPLDDLLKLLEVAVAELEQLNPVGVISAGSATPADVAEAFNAKMERVHRKLEEIRKDGAQPPQNDPTEMISPGEQARTLDLMERDGVRQLQITANVRKRATAMGLLTDDDLEKKRRNTWVRRGAWKTVATIFREIRKRRPDEEAANKAFSGMAKQAVQKNGHYRMYCDDCIKFTFTTSSPVGTEKCTTCGSALRCIDLKP